MGGLALASASPTHAVACRSWPHWSMPARSDGPPLGEAPAWWSQIDTTLRPSFYPGALAVVSPYAGELSWLFEELWATFMPAVGACKHAFFGDLADAVIQTNELHRLLHLAIVAAEAYLRGRCAESLRAGSDTQRTDTRRTSGGDPLRTSR